jgi:hypothetical protein
MNLGGGAFTATRPGINGAVGATIDKLNSLSGIGFGSTSSSAFAGSGSATKDASFTTTVSARIVKVLSNGNYFIAGTREILIDKQKQICKLTGEIAKFKGKKKKWWLTNVLYWNGVKFHRTSEEYKALIRRAYDCMYVQSHSFRRGLFFSKDAKLKHSIGKKDESRTVLTIDEFIGNLNRLREKGANDVLSN